MPTTKSPICLFKDLSVDRKGNWLYVYPKDINWSEQSENAEKLSSLHSLTDFVQKQQNSNSTSLTIQCRIVKEEMHFDIWFYKAFVEGLCGTVPKPFLQIKCREETPPTNAAGVTLEQRSELIEILDKSLTQRNLLLFSAKVSNSENFILDIDLGWIEGATKYIPAAKKLIGIDTTALMKSLFERDSFKDLTIVAGNGAEIKCHRFMFEIHSEVLAATISPNNGIQESKNGRFEMPENSEVGLTQLIRYFYGMQLNIDEISCNVAIELFKTAHKYKLAELQKWFAEILLKKGSDWFLPDELLDLYFYVKNVAEFKAIEDLAKEVRACERFKELKRTDAEAAIDLLSVLFDMK